MQKLNALTVVFLSFAFTWIHSSALHADGVQNDALIASVNNPSPSVIPSQPALNAKAFILIDVNSGKVLAEKNSDEKLPPASLTKMMTLYVVSKALRDQRIHLNDDIRVSETAWKTGGSRMFLKEGETVSIENLLKGIIVDSGNDACVAIAEHLGGSEPGFAEIMNQEAKNIGMQSSHFTDSTGLPNPDLYSTARDLAILGRALINDFPDYYPWYSKKWFTYNNIRQPNRNRLLWRNLNVDGVKTGHTNDAGFCLVSSAKRHDTRLLAVVLGEASEMGRADDSERLLNYGFRFYETQLLYKANTALMELPLYSSLRKAMPLGLNLDEYVTYPTGQYQHLSVSTTLPKFLQAPLKKGDLVGHLTIKYDDQIIANHELYALESAEVSGFFSRCADSVKVLFKQWLG